MVELVNIIVTVLPDLIFADGFESGDTSAWDKEVSGGLNTFTVSPTAALAGSGNGLEVDIQDNTPMYLVDESPEAESRYRVRFYFDPNGITMANGDYHNMLRGVQ